MIQTVASRPLSGYGVVGKYRTVKPYTTFVVGMKPITQQIVCLCPIAPPKNVTKSSLNNCSPCNNYSLSGYTFDDKL